MENVCLVFAVEYCCRSQLSPNEHIGNVSVVFSNNPLCFEICNSRGGNKRVTCLCTFGV